MTPFFLPPSIIPPSLALAYIINSHKLWPSINVSSVTYCSATRGSVTITSKFSARRIWAFWCQMEPRLLLYQMERASFGASALIIRTLKSICYLVPCKNMLLPRDLGGGFLLMWVSDLWNLMHKLTHLLMIQSNRRKKSTAQLARIPDKTPLKMWVLDLLNLMYKLPHELSLTQCNSHR